MHSSRVLEGAQGRENDGEYFYGQGSIVILSSLICFVDISEFPQMIRATRSDKED